LFRCSPCQIKIRLSFQIVCGFESPSVRLFAKGARKITPLQLTPLLSLHKHIFANLTSFAIAKSGGVVVGFIGTSDGDLLKVRCRCLLSGRLFHAH